MENKKELIIAIGASTGGTEAIAHIIEQLPGDMPPILIAQHMPGYFTSSYAARLNRIGKLEVREARNFDELRPGLALLAPGDFHLLLDKNGDKYFAAINQEPKMFFQRPSVELLFKSVARCAGSNAIGVILTGMGKDGATGLLALRNAGAITIGQDESTSVVYGMPRVAFELGAVEYQKRIEEIPETLIKFCKT